MAERIYIRGGRVIDPLTGRDEVADLFVEGERLAPLPLQPPPDARVIDAAGRVVVPGLIDLHVHFREPGKEAAETIASGARAAARGGFTTVVMMPNTTPPLDTPERVASVLAKGRETGIRVLTSACITTGRDGSALADLATLKTAGAVAFTDDGSTVADDAVLRQAMETAADLRVPILDHAVDPALAGRGVMHAGRVSAALGLPGVPAEAESRAVARNIRLAADTGASMHIQHLSTGAGAQLIAEARERGLPVTAEATPHHLALCDEDIDGSDADFKMNPPLGAAADRDALQAAIARGDVSALATDHAPHPAAEKQKGFLEAPFGIVGLETAIGVTYPILVESGLMTLSAWVECWTTAPARILGRPPPSLAPGSPADIAVLDLDHSWTVDPTTFLSRSGNTPFKGQTLRGRAVTVLCQGVVVHD